MLALWWIDRMPSILSHSSLATAICGYLVYLLGLFVWRLYLSPLSKFPGPKLAACTLWYEFYYDVMLDGQYAFMIERFHKEYGPIVRINPHELHVSDPAYYDVLYASAGSGQKRDKWRFFTRQLGPESGMFSTVQHERHVMRRAPLNRFFSMASVRRLQPMIAEKAEFLVERLRSIKDTGPTIANAVFAAYSNDVVEEYCFGQSSKRLEKPDFDRDYHLANVLWVDYSCIMKHLPWIPYILDRIPSSILAWISPPFASIVSLQEKALENVKRVKSQAKASYADLAHPTIFHELLQSNLPDSEKETNRLAQEAAQVVGAGTETTPWTLSVALYYLLASPHILHKLKAELKEAVPERNTLPSLTILEQLPYLSATIQEAIRLSYGLAGRSPRVSPEKPMYFTDKERDKDWVIPPGTPVGMSHILLLHNEYIFKDSYSFMPERWIEDTKLQKYQFAFGKGSRACIGMNLAYVELYIGITAVFRRFGSGGSHGVRFDDDEGVLELFETNIENVNLAHAAFLSFPTKKYDGVRFTIKS